jgi:pyruvate,water dikinase
LLSVDAAGSVASDGLRLPDGIDRWAVRSSASVEDGARFSFAGQFRTELDLSPAEVPDAVHRVVASAAERRPTAYGDIVAGQAGSAGSAGSDGRIVAPARMAVVFQEYREPTAAGVWLGRSTVAGRLEWCTGSGERLVSGAVIPAVEEWGADARRPGPGGALASRTGAVGAACLQLQREAAMPLDLELAVIDGDLVWLQARPVTRSLPTGGEAAGDRSIDIGVGDARSAGNIGACDIGVGDMAVADIGAGIGVGDIGACDIKTGAARSAGKQVDVFRGFAASSGTAQATGIVLRDPHDGKWKPGGILVVPTTDPDWLPLMVTAAGLVTASGGLLCHAAIVAREIGLPAVTGVGEALLSAADGRLLTIDGDAGTVTLGTR